MCGDIVGASRGQLAFVLNDTLAISFQVLDLQIGAVDARLGRRGGAQLHLDLGQAVVQLPLLLRQFAVERIVLGLDGVQTLAQPFDLLLERFVRRAQQRNGGARQMRQRIADVLFWCECGEVVFGDWVRTGDWMARVGCDCGCDLPRTTGCDCGREIAWLRGRSSEIGLIEHGVSVAGMDFLRSLHGSTAARLLLAKRGLGARLYDTFRKW